MVSEVMKDTLIIIWEYDWIPKDGDLLWFSGDLSCFNGWPWLDEPWEMNHMNLAGAHDVFQETKQNSWDGWTTGNENANGGGGSTGFSPKCLARRDIYLVGSIVIIGYLPHI